MSTQTSSTDAGMVTNWFGRLMRSNAFAWTISVGLHAALFVAFYQMGFGKTAAARRFIIPEARLAAGPVPVAARPDLPARIAPSAAPSPGGAAKADKAPRLDALPIVSVAGAGADSRDVVVSGPPLALPTSLITGTGSAGLSGSRGAGATVGPVSRFFGQAGNAYKVVYVVDVSASLMIYIDEIIREMNDSIRDLVPTQEFHIVLALPRNIGEFEPRRLVPANARYKAAAYDFVKSIAGTPKPGKADPIDAMKRAFAVGPELIYFLTDGDYPDIEADLEASLKQMNPRGDVKITVIGFDPSPAPRALLERIARTHGGHCRFVEPQ